MKNKKVIVELCDRGPALVIMGLTLLLLIINQQTLGQYGIAWQMFMIFGLLGGTLVATVGEYILASEVVSMLDAPPGAWVWPIWVAGFVLIVLWAMIRAWMMPDDLVSPSSTTPYPATFALQCLWWFCKDLLALEFIVLGQIAADAAHE